MSPVTPKHHQRLRSVSVSLATTVLDAGLFALATLVLVGPALLAARWIAGAVGASANFVLNRRWAFRASRAGLRSQLRRYAVTAVMAVSLATALWWLLHTLTGWSPRLLHLISLGAVWLGFTFPLLKTWVFRRPPPPVCALARQVHIC